MCYGMHCEYENRYTGECHRPPFTNCPAEMPMADADEDNSLEELEKEETDIEGYSYSYEKGIIAHYKKLDEEDKE